MNTIGNTISELKEIIKANKQDAFITDRFIYSLFLKHAKLLLRRQDSANKLMKFNPVFQRINYLELVEVDTIESQCAGIKSGTIIKRSKNKLPSFFEGYWGALIRSINSIDGSVEFQPTYPTTYINISSQKNFKYNKTKYYWFLDGYLYFPNIEWDAVRVEGLFESDVSEYELDCPSCVQKQDQQLFIPEFLFSEITQAVLKDLGIQLQVPIDQKDDKINPAR